MQYETVGGKIHDTEHHKVTIRELKIGDRFKFKYNKNHFEVVGEKCKWSSGGQSLRKVRDLNTGFIEFKRCNTQVFKL